jgi:GDSL-like Lipase/Acylhydrolase family
MNHVVLLGDSIFDNARYVPGEPSVIEHLRRKLPGGWQATLLARDGSTASDVMRQLQSLPPDASHLVVSAGGNDALVSSIVLHETADSIAEVLSRLADLHEEFQRDYRGMLTQVLDCGKSTAVCTVYDAIPNLSRVDRTGLCVFNDVILREAFRAGVPVIDLRLVCTDRDDYAPSSPIEPSVGGGGKIARAVGRLVMEYDGQGEGSRVVT